MKKLTFFLIILFNYSPLAAQIANDICNTAITLPLGYNCLELDDLNGTMTGATDEGSALPSCADGPDFRSGGNFDIWYAFTAPTTGKVLFRLFNRGFIDEAVVYSGSCTTLTEVICLNGVRDPTIFELTPNTNYYLRLNKSYAPEQTSEEFCLQLTEPPTNDICSDATPLPIGVACDGTFFNGDPRSATLEAPIKKCDGVESIYLLDTWYSFEAPLSGRVVVKLSSEGPENPPDFRVYQGTCAALEEIYCGQDAYNVDSIILVNPGTTYFIQTLASQTDGPFCIWVKEQISFDNLFYGVKTGFGSSGMLTELEYDQMGAPTAIELEEMGACDQTAFTRVEPAGVIKIKAIAPRCVEDPNTGKEAGVSAEGHWSINRYRLVGLTEEVIPVTFTFEFTGNMSFIPKDGNPSGVQCSFGFIYGFLTADDYTQDNGGGLMSHFGRQEVEYNFDNLAPNSGRIDILPEIDDGTQVYDLNSIIPSFIAAYNALSAAEKNDPNLMLTNNFLTAINQPVDISVWTTALQNSLNAEAANFLAALDHLGFDTQLGYDANSISVEELNYKHRIDYDYQRDLTVLIDNTDFSSFPSIWFNGKVKALNINNPYTVITDFSNTGRIGSITVPEEHLLDRDIHALQIGNDISIPIEVTGCTDAKLLLPELPISSREFTSADTITAKSIIESGKEVVFKSEKIVVLAPGFHAKSGSQLSVEIGEVPDCNVAPLTLEEDKGAMRIGLSEENKIIDEKELELTAYPNPFTSTTTIDYYLPVSAPVTIKVIDLFGQEKAILLDGSTRDAGMHRLTYRPDNISYGTYLVLLQSGAEVKMQKLLLIKE